MYHRGWWPICRFQCPWTKQPTQYVYAFTDISTATALEELLRKMRIIRLAWLMLIGVLHVAVHGGSQRLRVRTVIPTPYTTVLPCSVFLVGDVLSLTSSAKICRRPGSSFRPLITPLRLALMHIFPRGLVRMRVVRMPGSGGYLKENVKRTLVIDMGLRDRV